MAETSITVSEMIDEAVGFARDAWREAWAPMALVAAGWTLIVVGGKAQVTPGIANLCGKAGWGLLLAYWPLLGALYRFGIGGRAYRERGPGGLQLGGAEWRILSVNAVLAFLFLIACTPLVLLSGLFYMLLRPLGSVTLGPAGPWAWWFLSSAAVAAVLFVALAYLAGRLSMATPFSVEQRRTAPFTGWSLTEGRGRAIAVAYALAHLPALGVWLALQTFGWIEPADIPLGLQGPWPLPDAIAAGIVVGLVLSAVQAPLGVGLLTGLYDRLAPPEQALAAVPALDETAPPEPASEDAAAPEPQPDPEPEPEPDPPFSTVEFFAHTGRFSRIDAPWLAEEPVPALYAYLAGGAPKPPPSEPPPPHADAYPHSVVEYSPHTGRFSRLFSPWLAQDHDVEEAEPDSAAAPEPEPEAHRLPTPEPAPALPPERRALDAVGEAEHAEP